VTATNPHTTLSLPTAAWRVARALPFRVLRGRRLFGLLALTIVPVLTVVGVLAFGAERGLGVRYFVDFLSLFWFSAIIPVTLLCLGAGAVGDDIDNGTFLYLRLCPIPRSAIVVGRFLSTWFSALLLFVPVLCVQFLLQVGVRAPDLVFEEVGVLVGALQVVALASLVYAALFLTLALLFKRAIIIGLFFIVGWEAFVSKVPTGAAFSTVSFHSLAQMSHVTQEGWTVRNFLGPFREIDLVPGHGASALGLIGATIVILAFAGRMFAKKEYLDIGGE